MQNASAPVAMVESARTTRAERQQRRGALLFALLLLRQLHGWRRSHWRRRRGTGPLKKHECVLVQFVEILSHGWRRAPECSGQRNGCQKCDFAHVVSPVLPTG